MHHLQAAGVLLTAAGVVGYLIGLVAASPGRGLSVPGVMVGLTLFTGGGGFR